MLADFVAVARSRSATALASVDFPAPDSPVSQSVKPRRVPSGREPWSFTAM